MSLKQTVTHVLHNASPVDFNRSVASFEPHIRGVRKLIDFAHESDRRASVFFVSSISVVSNWSKAFPERSIVPEESIQDWRLPILGYGQSKMISERLLEEASRVSGVRTTVCRVGQIAGPARHGEYGQWPKQEWLPSLIASSTHLGMVPESLGSTGEVDWIPVDVLADVIVELLLGSSTIIPQSDEKDIRFFHAVNPRSLPWTALLPAVLDNMPAGISTVSLEKWVGELKRSNKDGLVDSTANPGVKLLGFFQGLQTASNTAATHQQARLDTQRTCEMSRELRELQAVSPAWMDLWMKQWAFQEVR